MAITHFTKSTACAAAAVVLAASTLLAGCATTSPSTNNAASSATAEASNAQSDQKAHDAPGTEGSQDATEQPAAPLAETDTQGQPAGAQGDHAASDNSTTRHYSTFSIIGDSYSTFNGYTTESAAAQWYPAADGSGNDVLDVSQTWWSLFADAYGASLLENNSWSGRPICHDGWGYGNDDAHAYSFTTAVKRIGDPELLLIFGGTNDSWIGVELGKYVYEGWTETDLRTFRGALSYVIDRAQSAHPGTRIVFMLNDDLTDSIDESVQEICAHYSVDVLELHEISKASSHPNRVGMQTIADQLLAYLANS